MRRAVRYGQANVRDRAISLGGVAVIHAVLGVLLVRGLAPGMLPTVDEAVEVFDLPAAPPPLPEPPPVPPRLEERRAAPRPKDPEGAASPANLRDTPTPVVAPEPIVPLPVPTPVTAAPIAAEGNRASAGAADVPGPGTGAGGIGTGRGSGMSGNGTGGGGGGGTGIARYARYIRGGIRDADWPDGGYTPGRNYVVGLRFTVMPTGRVRNCIVTRGSGSAVLDRLTCRLLERRMRYAPARDAEGRPVAQEIPGEHEWGSAPVPPDTWVEPTIPDDE